jgi:hypothetical protein
MRKNNQASCQIGAVCEKNMVGDGRKGVQAQKMLQMAREKAGARKNPGAREPKN